MLRGIYTAASGMMVQMERQNVISNNLANVNTNGFKKDQTIIQGFPEFDVYRKDDEKFITPFDETSKLTKIGKLGTGAQLKDVKAEFTQGTIVETGNELDFAISGDEFFVVDTANGLRLTRDGSFALSPEGFLVTLNGDRVLGMSEDGGLGHIQSNDQAIEVGKNGNLYGLEIIANSSIEKNNIKPGLSETNAMLTVNVENKNKLLKEGYNYFSFDQADVVTSENTLVYQGRIESSNVNSVREMVDMIDCSRAYETNQKVLTSQDEITGKAVSDIGRWV